MTVVLFERLAMDIDRKRVVRGYGCDEDVSFCARPRIEGQWKCFYERLVLK